MQIYSNNLRKTTREHHRPTRRYYIQPRGAERKAIEMRMPTTDYVPTLWQATKELIATAYTVGQK